MAVLSAALFPLAVQGANAPEAAVERRCGWFVNPTPSNYWLRDREATWILSAQGGYEAEGMDDLPIWGVKVGW